MGHVSGAAEKPGGRTGWGSQGTVASVDKQSQEAHRATQLACISQRLVSPTVDPAACCYAQQVVAVSQEGPGAAPRAV